MRYTVVVFYTDLFLSKFMRMTLFRSVQGGAMFMCRTTALISNCRLVENTARVSDGRILAWAIHYVSHHSYAAAAQSGGALSAGLNGTTYVRVEDSRFESNHAKVRCDLSSVSCMRRSAYYRWHCL